MASRVPEAGDERAEHRTDEWNASVYHRVSGPQTAWGERVLARISLRGDETVLDAGCGTGRLTAHLLEQLPQGRVIAVDQSTNMLQVAAEYLTPRFGERVTFVHADVARLDLSEAADLIFSTATFHWVLDHDLLFRTLYRALKPGGRLVAQCGGGPILQQLRRRAGELMQSEPFAPSFVGWETPWEFADPETTARRLQSAGFIEVETGLEHAPVVLNGPEEYAEFVRNVIFRLHLERMGDEALRERFMGELTTAAAGDDPPYSLDYWRLNLQATRPL